MKKILFISVDGTQNYLKPLFLPTLSRVQNQNTKIEILEFCPHTKVLLDELTHAGIQHNVPVFFGRYFNQPPVIGSFLFIVYGAFRTMYIVQKNKIDLLMPRSLLAGTMALLVRMVFNRLEIVYDSDGLMSDERADFGSWSRSGLLYRFFQTVEKKLVRDANIVITRTHKAKDILLERSPGVSSNKIIVIPNGKDPALFKITSFEQRMSIRREYGIEDEPLLVYVGSIGKQYRPGTMIEIYRRFRLKRDDAKLLILTPNPDEIKEVVASAGIETEGVIVDRVDPDKIAAYIAAADIGLALREPAFSQQAVCPLKVIEYLMCGIPVVTNAGVGDLDVLFAHHELGYMIQDLDNPDYEDITEFIQRTLHIDVDTKQAIRNITIANFELDALVERYRTVLEAE